MKTVKQTNQRPAKQELADALVKLGIATQERDEAREQHRKAIEALCGAKAMAPVEAPREKFATGAVRGTDVAGGTKAAFPLRFDLLLSNTEAIRRLAATYGEGSMKYGDDNWRAGIPEKSLINHAIAHLMEHLAGDSSEDNLAHATWNLLTLMWNQANKPELLNLSQLAQTGITPIVPVSPVNGTTQPCPSCGGRGRSLYDTHACGTCNGEGVI